MLLRVSGHVDFASSLVIAEGIFSITTVGVFCGKRSALVGVDRSGGPIDGPTKNVSCDEDTSRMLKTNPA